MNWEAIDPNWLARSPCSLVYLSFQIRNAREEARQNNESANQELTPETVRNPT